MLLKEKIEAILPLWRERVNKLVKESGEVKVGEVNIVQVYGGMRDVKGLVTDISYVDPSEGIRFRGYTIPEVLEKLPKPSGAEMPYLGGLYYLLLVGEFPTMAEAQEVERELADRSRVPQYVFDVIEAMPCDAHPMTLFSQAVLALQHESLFARKYTEGMKRDMFWEPMLEDSLNLAAKLPEIATYIYRVKCTDNQPIQPHPKLDWGANFAHMMGIPELEYQDLSRLYLLLYSDHESGNVIAHTTHLVGSTLSDIYYAFSAGLNGLAGPLHGLANQEALRWLLSVYKKYNGVPSREQLRQFARDTLSSGQVIPGYGHGVLRKTDPRYIKFLEFGKKYMPDDDILRLAGMVYEVIPSVLQEMTRAKDPWPNVDAISGVLQYHYGVHRDEFYTVNFGVGRFLGVSANLVWARALGQPLERPKSLTTTMLEDIAQKAKSAFS
jgi:citrate synthase